MVRPCPSEGNQNGVSVPNSVILSGTFCRITQIRDIAQPWGFDKLFIYLFFYNISISWLRSLNNKRFYFLLWKPRTFGINNMERFHSRDQWPYWFNETKESISIKIEFNSQKVSLVHQYGRRPFVLVHQHTHTAAWPPWRVTSCENALYVQIYAGSDNFVFRSHHIHCNWSYCVFFVLRAIYI